MQKVTQHSRDTIHSILKPRNRLCKKGAPAKLSSHDIAKVLKVAEAMIKKANGQQEITLPMILQKAGHDVSETTVRKHFKKEKIAFFKLKEKPLLEMGDLEERKKWADAHKRRTPAQWVTHPQAIIDNKSFHMVTCRKGREFAARRSIRGAYQRKGSLPKKWLVKPKCGTNKAKVLHTAAGQQCKSLFQCKAVH